MRVKGSWSFEETKTEESERMIPLPAALVDLLKTHKAKVRKRQLKADLWHDHDLVFPGAEGNPLDISAVRRRHFKKICAKAGLADVTEIPAREKTGKRGPAPKPKKIIKPWFTPYSLRHTAASLLARAGAHPKVAATVLGHADIATTLGVYTHSADDLERKAVGELAELVGFPKETNEADAT